MVQKVLQSKYSILRDYNYGQFLLYLSEDALYAYKHITTYVCNIYI